VTHCHNCKGDHPAYSRECPSYAKAKYAESVSAHYRITYSQALKQIKTHAPVSSPKPIHTTNQAPSTNIQTMSMPIISSAHYNIPPINPDFVVPTTNYTISQPQSVPHQLPNT
jgi:hypothetical protein